jgi:putative ABC transport system ATP-binding protein
MASNDMLFRADHLSRAVPGKLLVADVTFAVHPAEILAIFGPSGSGKSSLLRLLNRLDEPTEGTVYLNEVDYRQIPPSELRRRVGMVTQRAYLFPGTVADNLRFGPRQRGQQLSDTKIDELLISVHLAGFAARDVANLSGGEAQRVSFARTLANEPETLLLDEPTSALDEEAKRELESVIQRIAQEQKIACILVTHDGAQAQRLADRALILEQGRVVRIGPWQQIKM